MLSENHTRMMKRFKHISAEEFGSDDSIHTGWLNALRFDGKTSLLPRLHLTPAFPSRSEMDKGLVGWVYRVNPAGWPAILDDDPEECQQLISPKLEGVTMEVIICSSVKPSIQMANLSIFPNIY